MASHKYLNEKFKLIFNFGIAIKQVSFRIDSDNKYNLIIEQVIPEGKKI